MNRHSSPSYCAVLLLLVCWALCGCGTKAYEEKFEESLADLRRQSPFLELFMKPVRFPLTAPGQSDLVLSMRIPKALDVSKFEIYALDADTPEPREPTQPLQHDERRQPSFLQLGGHVRTYERIERYKVANKDRQRPLYFYVAVIPKKHPDATENLMDKIEEDLKAAFLKTPGPSNREKSSDSKLDFGVKSWESLQLPNPVGSTTLVYRIAAQGRQSIYHYVNNDVTDPKQKKTTEITDCVVYINPTPSADVVVAWYTTHFVNRLLDFRPLVEASIGTAKIHSATEIESGES